MAGTRGGGIEGEIGDEGIDGPETLRIGEDVRFVVAVVGGGAVRIGQRIARRHVRHLETVAVNCDARVQEADEFDRRVYLGSGSADDPGTGGSPSVGGRLAHAAEPALDRVFEGATVVTLVASLGGGTGTGALPAVLEAAARNAEFVSLFVVKPFAAESERRAIAERSIARLHFLEAFTDRLENHRASLHVLDNEELARHGAQRGFNSIAAHWADAIVEHIEGAFLRPIEAQVEAHRLERLADRPPRPLLAAPVPPTSPGPGFPEPPIPLAPTMEPGRPEPVAELTFEVFPSGGGPTDPSR